MKVLATDLTQVKKKHRKQLQTLLNGLMADATKAMLENRAAPEFDLCQVSVPGTNLFCHGNKGIPRSQMPQLKGFPVSGSPADGMLKDKNGKVDTSQQFLEMLEQMQIKTRRYKIDPTKLKASQNQLVGAKIALRVNQMESNPNHKKFKMDYFISKDGYILDGHHGWASVLAYSLIHKKRKDIKVIEVNMKIKPLIRLANQFMSDVGIRAKDASVTN